MERKELNYGLKELDPQEMREASEAMNYFVDTIHWNRFRLGYAAEITESGHDVGYEVVQLSKLCAVAVAQYNGLATVLPRAAAGTLGDDAHRVAVTIQDFGRLVEMAEMKALWLNRECRRLTGKYFFKGRLEKDQSGRSFTLRSMYGLVHQMFKRIDPIVQ